MMKRTITLVSTLMLGLLVNALVRAIGNLRFDQVGVNQR